MPKNEVATVGDSANSVTVRADENAANAVLGEVQRIGSGDVGVYSSMKADTFDDKLATVNALSNALPLSEHLGERILLKDFIAQAVTVSQKNPKNDEIEEIPSIRLILVAVDGTAYSAVSDGVFKSLKNLVGILGEPSRWDAPVPVVAESVQGRNGFKFTTLRIG